MAELLTPAALGTLAMLIFLQAVLGFDNLLYISIESKRCPKEQQSMVRKLGIGIAIVLRLVLLFLLVSIIERFRESFTSIELGAALQAEPSIHSLIVLGGGVFIIYTAIKELLHMVALPDLASTGEGSPRSASTAIALIVVMNLVFSFDSILAAISLTTVVKGEQSTPMEGAFTIMAIAIVISGVLMIALANTVAEFLRKNRLYEVLGLFILLIVGVMLITEGGELAHLQLFGHPVEAMSKSTFYFVIIVLVLVDVVQGRYQKKLMLEQEHAASSGG